MSNIHGVAAQGQSIWMDEISRQLLEPEGLAALVDGAAVTGVTSNPTIFANAIVGSSDYDQALRELVARDAEAFWGEARRVEDRYNVCGLTALACLLEILPPCACRVLGYELWHEAPTQSAVSFAAALFCRDGAPAAAGPAE